MRPATFTRPLLHFIVTLALGLALAGGGGVAAASESSHFVDGVRAYRSGDYQGARDLFLAARAEQPDSGAALFNLGLCYYQLRDYPAARRSFLALRSHAELTAVAEYHLGLVAARTGQHDRAAAHLRAAATSDSRDLRRLAQAALQMLGDRPIARVPAGYVLMAGGSDTNRNRIDDGIEIPGRDRESSYTEMTGALQYPLPWLQELDLRASAFQRDYTTDDALDQRSLQLALRKTWRLRPWQFTLALETEAAHVLDTGVVTAAGLGLQAVRRAGGATFRARYQPAAVRAESDLDFLDGRRQRAEVVQELQLGGLLLAAGYDLEDNDQSARALDDASGTLPPRRHGPFFRMSRAITPRLTVDVNGAWRQGRYAELAGMRREDEVLSLGSAVRLRLHQGWGLRLDYRYWDNRSNIELFDYDRHMVQLGIDWRI